MNRKSFGRHAGRMCYDPQKEYCGVIETSYKDIMYIRLGDDWVTNGAGNGKYYDLFELNLTGRIIARIYLWMVKKIKSIK